MIYAAYDDTTMSEQVLETGKRISAMYASYLASETSVIDRKTVMRLKERQEMRSMEVFTRALSTGK